MVWAALKLNGRGAEIERRQQTERLADRNRAGRGRACAADAMIAIWHADRLTFLGAVIGNILGRQRTRPARIALHRLGDVGGDVALVERRMPSRAMISKVSASAGFVELITDRPGPSLVVEEIGARIGRESLGPDIGQQLGEAGRDREAVARKRDRRLEQLGPGELAVFVVHQLQRGEYAGRRRPTNRWPWPLRATAACRPHRERVPAWRRPARSRGRQSSRASWRPRPNRA